MTKKESLQLEYDFIKGRYFTFFGLTLAGFWWILQNQKMLMQSLPLSISATFVFSALFIVLIKESSEFHRIYSELRNILIKEK